MATAQLTASSISGNGFASFEGLRSNGTVKVASLKLNNKSTSFRCLVVKAATTVAPKYTSVKPLGDRVLVKTRTAEERTVGGILLPVTALEKSQGGEVVAVGKTKADIGIKTGAQVIFSKYAGIEVEFNEAKHLILKVDDIVGILETDDIKDLQPLNDRVLIKVAKAEEKTPGGLILTEAAKEKKPSNGTVVAVGPGPLDEEGKRKPLPVSPGDTVIYSKYAGNEFKGADGSLYITLGVSDLLALIS